MFKLFRMPETGESVVIGADPADGGSDYCSAVAKSKKHADSLMVFHARLDSAQFGYELFKMGLFFKKKTTIYPNIGVERNTGSATIHVLQELNYTPLFRMPVLGVQDKREEEKIGWVTSSATRPKMLDELALSLKQRVNKIYDEETIRELYAFIRNAKTGKPQASQGSHDDLVFAEAIAWQLYQLVKSGGPGSWQDKISQFPKQKLFDKKGLY